MKKFLIILFIFLISTLIVGCISGKETSFYKELKEKGGVRAIYSLDGSKSEITKKIFTDVQPIIEKKLSELGYKKFLVTFKSNKIVIEVIYDEAWKYIDIISSLRKATSNSSIKYKLLIITITPIPASTLNTRSNSEISKELSEKGGVQIHLSIDKNQGKDYSKKDLNLTTKMIDSYLSRLGYKTRKVGVDKSNNIEIEIEYDEFIASSEIIKVVDYIRNGTIPGIKSDGSFEKLPIKFGPIDMQTIYPKSVRKSNP